MTAIALLGAGGKMGLRIARNLRSAPHAAHYLEVSPEGRRGLADLGLEAAGEEVLGGVDVAIFALPDTMLEELTARYVPRLRAGALVVLLDPACPYAGVIAEREDLAYAVAHPCHPSVFNWEPTEGAFRDFYGGVGAKQAVLLAMMRGGADDRTLAEEVARAIYAPVHRVHDVALEHMAVLEPAMVETLAQTCMEVIRDGYDHVVEMGVPSEAARDIVLGHLRIQIAVLFGEVDGGFSDAAYRISERARPLLFRDDWHRVLELGDLREQIACITDRPAA